MSGNVCAGDLDVSEHSAVSSAAAINETLFSKVLSVVHQTGRGFDWYKSSMMRDKHLSQLGSRPSTMLALIISMYGGAHVRAANYYSVWEGRRRGGSGFGP